MKISHNLFLNCRSRRRARKCLEMASSRFWSEDHSSYTDIMTGKGYSEANARILAEAFFEDHVRAAAGIVMPEETDTDPDVFYDGVLIFQ